MTRTVFCQKLQQELEGMDSAPYPSELGQRIFDHISQKAWDAWINHQTMLINEYRLSLLDPKSKTFQTHSNRTDDEPISLKDNVKPE